MGMSGQRNHLPRAGHSRAQRVSCREPEKSQVSDDLCLARESGLRLAAAPFAAACVTGGSLGRVLATLVGLVLAVLVIVLVVFPVRMQFPPDPSRSSTPDRKSSSRSTSPMD
jgi:hypothetical protein